MNKVLVNSKKNTIVQNLFHKNKFKSLGENLRFGGVGQFYNSQNITISDNVYIGRGFYMEAISDINIGSGTMIGPNVTIIAGSHNYNSRDLKAIPYDKRIINTPVIIEKNVWIGANVIITPGAIIEEGAVIGMGAIVAGRVPKYSVVVSSKQHIIKSRDSKVYEKLKESGQIYNTCMVEGNFEIVERD